MRPAWFNKRIYKHFDAPVGKSYALRLESGESIQGHSWSPLIRYEKIIKRYKPNTKKTTLKIRPIMYASHRDACILSKFSFDLTRRLDAFYEENDIGSSVIGYRKLSKSNYEFSSDAHKFAKSNTPCVVLCFDITGFFDNIDHKILKSNLKKILKCGELDTEWYQVFRHVTKYHYINRELLKNHPIFGPRLKSKRPQPVASIREIKDAGIQIIPNQNQYGIPQGTPISSAFSNLYMTDVDLKMTAICRSQGALYQRYSDDIIVICKNECEEEIRTALIECVTSNKLKINEEKIERADFDGTGQYFQYLGFNINESGAVIRPASLSRQWRKLKRNIRITRANGEKAIKNGKSDIIFTKRLRRKFYPVGFRNFSSYARRAAKTFESKAILRQILRLERHADNEIRLLKASNGK